MMNLVNYMRRLSGLNRNAKLFLLSTLVNGLGISLFILLYNLYIMSLGFHEDMIGLLTAVASMVAVVAALPTGWLANRLGYKAAQFWGVIGSAISVVVPLVWTDAAAFIVCELIWGVAFTMVVIVGSPFITENSTEEERPYLFSLQFVLMMLTTAIGCFFGGGLPGLFANWLGVGAESPAAYQGALWVGTALLGLSALPFLFLKPGSSPRAHTVRPRITVRQPMVVSRLLIPGIIGAIGGGMFVPFVNVLWKVSHNLNDTSVGQILAASGLLMSIVGVVAPMVSRRWGLVRVNVVSLVLSALALLIFGFSPFIMFALVGYLGRDALVNLSRPLTQQFQMERSEVEERAAVSSLYTMGVNIAWGIGSWVSGIWQTQGWFPLVFASSAAFSLLSALLWHKLFGQAPQKNDVVDAEPDAEPLSLPLPVGSPAE